MIFKNFIVSHFKFCKLSFQNFWACHLVYANLKLVGRTWLRPDVILLGHSGWWSLLLIYRYISTVFVHVMTWIHDFYTFFTNYLPCKFKLLNNPQRCIPTMNSYQISKNCILPHDHDFGLQNYIKCEQSANK